MTQGGREPEEPALLVVHLIWKRYQEIDALQLEGKLVTIHITAIWAKCYDRNLKRLKKYILFPIVRCFFEAKYVVMRASSHKSQEDPKLKVELAL